MPSQPDALPDIVIVFDLETTGFKPDEGHRIIEIGAVPIIEGKIREDCAFQSLIDPDRSIPAESTRVHHITDEMVKGQPHIDVVLPEFLRYCGEHAVAGQNVIRFDLPFVAAACGLLDLKPPPGAVLDTLPLSRQLFPGARKHSLDDICYRLDIDAAGAQRHRAIDDVLLTAEALLRLSSRMAEKAAARS
jgi:DNA polymerase-3 subunit epsilon